MLRFFLEERKATKRKNIEGNSPKTINQKSDASRGQRQLEQATATAQTAQNELPRRPLSEENGTSPDLIQ